MRCPALTDLPAPPSGTVGWPWTEGSDRVPPAMPGGEAWPRISVVTPSFNQARFLEATLRSILLQGYPDIELFVMDGGSTDGSVDIIKKYAQWITHWVSEPDGGQSAAINRGLRKSTGLFATWLNSDDLFERNAFTTHATRVGFQSDKIYIGDCLYIDAHARPLNLHRGRIETFEDLIQIPAFWRNLTNRGHIVQPEVLFPLLRALEVGGLNPDNHQTMDFELWGKLLLAGATLQYTHIPFAMFRIHAAQKTSQAWKTTRSLVDTAARLLAAAEDVSEKRRQELLADLQAYERSYWRGTGPLARIGLPPNLVLPVRDFGANLRRRVGDFARKTSHEITDLS